MSSRLVPSPIWPADFSRVCHNRLGLGISDKLVGNFSHDCSFTPRRLRVALKNPVSHSHFPSVSIDPSLSRICLPTYRRPTCHIAGTNGKGSVSALLSFIL